MKFDPMNPAPPVTRIFFIIPNYTRVLIDSRSQAAEEYYNEDMTKLYSFISASMHNHYAITLPDQTILTMFIGKPNPALDTLLAENQAFSYAYLTAFNPQSTTLTPEENQIRQDQPAKRIGYPWIPLSCRIVLSGRWRLVTGRMRFRV